MKKSLLILMICFGSVLANAQNKAVNKATRLLEKGSLAEAKEQIDMAVEHEKTKDKSKTWYTKGQVYGAIAMAEDESVRSLAPEALEESAEAYRKAMELEDRETAPMYFLSQQAIDEMWGQKINAGVNTYNDSTRAQDPSRFEDALQHLDQALMVKPQDSLASIIAGIVAKDMGDQDKAATYFYNLVETGKADKGVYNELIAYERDVKENFEKAEEVIKAAQEQYPGSTDFKRQEVGLLIKQNKTAEAKQELEEAIAAEPDDANLYFNLGFLNEELEDQQAAIEAYKKALEVDPTHQSSAFNLAVIHYNRALDLVKEANNLGISQAERKKERELLEKSTERFKEAIPHLEKALELQPENRTLTEITMVTYDRAGNKEKAQELQQKLDGMPEQQ